MTPPAVCLNCHGSPETPPVLSELERLSQETEAETLPSHCHAHERWPVWLRTSHQGMQRFPWWVRGNYETTRGSQTPFRIDIEDADIDLRVHTRAGADLPLVRGAADWLNLHSGDRGVLTSHWEIRNNQIPLMLRSLLTFQDIQASGPLGINLIDLDRVSVGDFGGLHLIGAVPSWVLFFTQPFMVPVPPVGYDDPTEDQYERVWNDPTLAERCFGLDTAGETAGVCPSPLVYPDRSQAMSPLDLDLVALLPPRLKAMVEAFLQPNGRLPRNYNLEELITRAFDLRNRRLPPASPYGLTLQDWQNFFSEGELTVNLSELRDFFWPGVIDLGPSVGLARIHYSESGAIEADIPDLEINLDPMGYPARNQTTPPPLRLLSGRITAGPLARENSTVFIDPGIHLRFHPERNELQLTANLRLETEVVLPFAGQIQIRGNIQLDTTWVRTPEGLRPLPGTTTLRLSHGEIRRPHASAPAVRDLELSLTDDPAHMDSANAALSTADPQPRTILHLEGVRGGHRFLADGQLRFRMAENGLYALPRTGSLLEILGTLPVEDLNLEFHRLPNSSRGNGGLHAHIHFQGHPTDSERTEEENPIVYTLSVRADRLEGRQLRPVPLIRGGEIQFEYSHQPRETPPHEQVQLNVSAELFRYPISLGTIALNDLALSLAIDRLRLSEGESRIRIPQFTIAANGRRPATGMVRGPIQIAQSGEESLEIIWGGTPARVEVTGLDLGLNGQRIYALPEGVLRALDPEVASVGIDGHFQGNFILYTPPDRRCWHGEGDLRLSGDSQGDIYWLDARGRRVGPPLLRNTRWNWRRITWINQTRGYALGDFSLETIVDLSATPGFSPDLNPMEPFSLEPYPAFGHRGRGRLGPYELLASLPHYDNQPWSLTGFHNRIVDYIRNLSLMPQTTAPGSSPRPPRFCREGGRR